MTASGTDYLKLHFIVFLWGFSAIFGKLVSIPAVEMVFFRSLLAAIGMGIVIYFSKGQFSVHKNDLIKLMLIGFIVSFHWLCFFGAARVSNVSVSLVGFATNSLWTAVLETVFNRSKIKKYEVILGCIVLLGLYIIFSFDFQYKLGLFLGVLAGFTSALFSILNSKLVTRIGARTITFYEMIGVFIATALFLPVYKIISPDELQLIPAPLDWLWIAMLAVVCSVYAYTVAVDLMKRISVFMIQLTLNLEPLYGIIMAVIIFGNTEKMNLNFYMGTFVILTAVVAYPFLKKKFEPKAAESQLPLS
jgi:drug/metabolite transporter (DMT)-like permease